MRPERGRWARTRDAALALCAGWLVVQNLALLVMVPRATLVRALGDAAGWVAAHPSLALGMALVPLAVAVTLVTGMALGALLARPLGQPDGTEESHV